MMSGPDKFQLNRGRLRNEFKKLIKFVVVGAGTFCIQAVLYFVFSRWLFSGINRTLVYVLVLLISLIFNYSTNRAWTFGAQEAAKGSAKRYVHVAIAANVLNVFLFWLGHELFQVFDLIVLVAVNLMIPFFTFAMHRLYTFHSQPQRLWRKIVRSSLDSV